MELIRIYIERNILWSTLRIIKSFICRNNPLPPDRPSFNIAFICKRHPLHRAIPKSTSAPPELQNLSKPMISSETYSNNCKDSHNLPLTHQNQQSFVPHLAP